MMQFQNRRRAVRVEEESVTQRAEAIATRSGMSEFPVGKMRADFEAGVVTVQVKREVKSSGRGMGC